MPPPKKPTNPTTGVPEITIEALSNATPTIRNNLAPLYSNETLNLALEIATKHRDADDAISNLASKANIPKAQAAQALFAATGMTELAFSKQVEATLSGIVHDLGQQLPDIIENLPDKHKINAFNALTDKLLLLSSRNAQADKHLAKNKSKTTSLGHSSQDMIDFIKGADNAIDITPEPQH